MPSGDNWIGQLGCIIGAQRLLRIPLIGLLAEFATFVALALDQGSRDLDPCALPYPGICVGVHHVEILEAKLVFSTRELRQD